MKNKGNQNILQTTILMNVLLLQKKGIHKSFYFVCPFSCTFIAKYANPTNTPSTTQKTDVVEK